MELRALLFTSDGESSAVLCEVLTELGIEAEICSEMLVAAGRIAREHYDAIIVDWSQDTEAAFLLKTLREKRAQSLNLVLVSDDTSIPRALQEGANSVIKKPIDSAQARDTLSTARGLILSRRSEKREKEARIAAEQAEMEALPELPVEEAPAQKTGYLPQGMSRSALEAEGKIVKPDYVPPTNFQVARGPAALEEEHQSAPEPPVEPISQQRWDHVRSVLHETSGPETREEEQVELAPEPRVSQDSTGVFSSPPEEPGAEEPVHEAGSSAPPRYLVFAVVACLLVAAVLYVWAPGDSYLGRMSSAFHAFSLKSRSSEEKPRPSQPAPQATATEKPAVAPAPPSAEEMFASDAGPIPSTDVDPSKIQIIETKTIPKAGAQQPPTDNPTPEAATPQSPTAAGTPADTAPAVQETAPVAPPPVAPTVQPAVRAPAPAPVPESPTSPSEGRTGVIIPESLKNSPSAAPASSLETSMVPEETSLGLLIQKVDPDYPPQAVQQHLQGPVILQAWITKDGSVRDVKLVKGYFILARTAFDAVKQWRFKPYAPNGKAIDFQTVLTVNFKSSN